MGTQAQSESGLLSMCTPFTVVLLTETETTRNRSVQCHHPCETPWSAQLSRSLLNLRVVSSSKIRLVFDSKLHRV